MGQEGVKIKDSVSILLYDENGKLLSTSEKKKPLLDRILFYLHSKLEDSK